MRQPLGPAPSSAVIDDAIGWLVLLRSGEATTTDRSAFDTWLGLDSRHRAAWERLSGQVDGAFAAARAINQRAPGQADAIARTLARAGEQARQRRRVLRGALALGGVGLGLGVLAQRFTPLETALADLRTGTGERRSFTLADGSTLLLNARSAADVRYTGVARTLQLRAGECIAAVQADPGRPFQALCRHGHVLTPAGGSSRFVLRQEDRRSLVVVLEGTVEARGPAGSALPLLPGSAAWLDAAGARPATEQPASAASAWQHGLFVIDDQPLGEVIAALRPYRTGLLRISPQAARLRVHGSYPLDDTDRALAIIADTLPVQVLRHSGGWLVRIDVAPPASV